MFHLIDLFIIIWILLLMAARAFSVAIPSRSDWDIRWSFDSWLLATDWAAQSFDLMWVAKQCLGWRDPSESRLILCGNFGCWGFCHWIEKCLDPSRYVMGGGQVAWWLLKVESSCLHDSSGWWVTDIWDGLGWTHGS